MAHKINDDVVSDDGLGDGSGPVDAGIVLVPIGQKAKVLQPIVHDERLVRMLQEDAGVVRTGDAVAFQNTSVGEFDLDTDGLDVEQLVAHEFDKELEYYTILQSFYSIVYLMNIILVLFLPLNIL